MSKDCHTAKYPGRCPRPNRGFTLIEVLVVVVILGVLSTLAISRFVGRASFAEYAAQDQLVSALRYAQQVAMMNGPDVNGSQPVVRFVLSNGNYRITRDGIALVLPGLNATNAQLADVTTNNLTLAYHPLGDTQSGMATITISGSEVTLRVCVEATGYAHEC